MDRKSAGHYAETLLNKLKITSLPVNPRQVAEALNIQIIEQEAGDRFGGYLMDVEGEKAIVINSSTLYETKRNFTIAHEIGHAEIPSHTSNKGEKCLSDDIEFLAGNKDVERQANEFASELLMPTALISRIVKFSDVNFDTIKVLSEKCQTSLTSASLRYVKDCPEPCAIVVTENGKIKYFSLSSSLIKKKVFFNTGTSVNKLSLAYDFFNGKLADKNEKKCEIDIKAWFPSFSYSDYKCYEHSISLKSFNQVISLVWLEPNPVNYDQEDDEEDIYIADSE
jgi:Zn-dependent peptidase ImmA (M78 family)